MYAHFKLSNSDLKCKKKKRNFNVSSCPPCTSLSQYNKSKTYRVRWTPQAGLVSPSVSGLL